MHSIAHLRLLLLFPLAFLLFNDVNAMLKSAPPLRQSKLSISSSFGGGRPKNVSSLHFSKGKPDSMNLKFQPPVEALKANNNRRKEAVVAQASAHGSNNGVEIREAVPEDAKEIFEFFEELVTLAQDSRRIDKTLHDPQAKMAQLGGDMRKGVVQALVVESDAGVVGYALYYFGASSHRGKEGMILHLADINVDPSYKNEVEHNLLHRLAEIAKAHEMTSIEWAASRAQNPGTIEFFFSRLTGTKALTQAPHGQQEAYWRLSVEEFVDIKDGDIDKKDGGVEDYVVKLEGSKLEAEKANELAAEWRSFSHQQDSKENMSKVAQLLVEGKLQAMTVSHGGKRVAIALFHTNAYALWEGQYVWLDMLAVDDYKLPKGSVSQIINKIMSALVQKAEEIGAKRIEWNADDRMIGAYTSIFGDLGAINMTKQEQWVLFNWDYHAFLTKHGQLESEPLDSSPKEQ